MFGRGAAATPSAGSRWNIIDAAPSAPKLAELAREAGLSRSHTHRLFKAVTGVTPRAYVAARRAERMRTQLAEGSSVTRAVYGAGYGSSSRFYEQAGEVLGMQAKNYRAGGVQCVIHFAVGKCCLGTVLVAATERGICAIFLGDRPAELIEQLRRRFSRARVLEADPGFERLLERVIPVIEEPERAAALPLDIQGTAFQARVWQALCRVPPGETTTYAALARAIGQGSAVRAVAQACASNPIAVAIPCHRVLRSDGSLSGYRWGIERKRQLLERESRAGGKKGSSQG